MNKVREIIPAGTETKKKMLDTDHNKHKRILLGHLGRRGDCLYATTIARQIKMDFPDSHLTWAVSTMCRSIVEGNPFVDEIWELPLTTNEEIVAAWDQFEIDALNKKNVGEYDEVYFTQVHPGHFQNYDGTSRASIFRGYPRPITVSVQPIVRLSNQEIDNVRRFVDLHKLTAKKHVVLFECASTSWQSFVTPEFAVNAAQIVHKKHPDACFILSSDISLNTSDPHIIDGSVLSFKENAELTKYCTLLVGCSSGISWLATSDWAKPLPKIQILSADTLMYASMIHDANYFGLSEDQMLEMQDCSPENAASCIEVVFNSGFATAKTTYHQHIPLDFSFYLKQLCWQLLIVNELGKTVDALEVAIERFGQHPQLIYFLNNIVLPYADIMWKDLSKKDQTLLIDRVNYTRPHGLFVVVTNIWSLCKLFKALFRADTHIVSRTLLIISIKKIIL